MGSLAQRFAAASPGALALGWALMLLAMMAPMLVPAIYQIRMGSFVRRRARTTALFVLGYGAVWMLAGGGLMAVELVARWRAPGSYLPALVVALVALVWQASPGKQRCLNRCHRHEALPAFGWTADWGALRLGGKHGLWCVASCWATMLVPMLLPHGQFPAMLAVSLLMSAERLDPPRAPSWRWRGFGTAWRYLLLRWRGPQTSPMPFASGAPA
jgi:predicted metal-binding membrane protein